MKYGIIVDSGCDIRDWEKYEDIAFFQRVALKLRVGEKEYVDDLSLNIEEFMKEMVAYKGKTGSAAPSPQEWLSAYEKAEEIFVVTITSALSGSYASAMVARDMFLEKEPNKKIHMIDSKSAGPEVSLIVEKLVEYMRAGDSFEEMEEKITAYQEHTHIVFALESLDNLIKNGRVSKLQGGMAGLLGIKILGCASDEGTFEMLHKCRGKNGIYDKLIDEMEQRAFAGGKVIISHCENKEKALYLKEKIKEQYISCDVTIMNTSGLCSYYVEYGGLLLGFEDGYQG